MNNSEEYRKFLLSNIPSASLASGNRFINCRCFNCPDSSDPRSKHFYIHIPENDNDPSWYYCHKCHCSGLVTHKTLIEWGIYNEQIGLYLNKLNKRAKHNPRNNKYYNDRIVYNIKNTYITEDKVSYYKLQYINDRIGTNFNFQDLLNLKIVLNLNDILKANNIQSLTRDQRVVSQLDGNFVGFLSIDNAFLNMRRVCEPGKLIKSIDKRYINYKLVDKFDTTKRFYTVPTTVDLNTVDPIKIHIAEGPFDILSIYQNLRKRENGIYTSVAGSNYNNIILYFLQTFKLPYTEFHLYPDNDKFGSLKVMERIAKTFYNPLRSSIYIHRNKYPNQKDFGVSMDKIDESIIQIR